jgi:hypothetical protein
MILKLYGIIRYSIILHYIILYYNILYYILHIYIYIITYIAPYSPIKVGNTISDYLFLNQGLPETGVEVRFDF